MKFSPKRKAEIFQKTVQNAINLADIKYQIDPENLMVAETLGCDAPPAHAPDGGAARVRPVQEAAEPPPHQEAGARERQEAAGAGGDCRGIDATGRRYLIFSFLLILPLAVKPPAPENSQQNEVVGTARRQAPDEGRPAGHGLQAGRQEGGGLLLQRALVPAVPPVYALPERRVRRHDRGAPGVRAHLHLVGPRPGPVQRVLRRDAVPGAALRGARRQPGHEHQVRRHGDPHAGLRGQRGQCHHHGRPHRRRQLARRRGEALGAAHQVKAARI
ncbi:hypothetical protein ON010_g2183 [Phytophthora cinnamomi]|nr:hypothetical protein ON010_g2183 [Phytophthora cinnamomi]